MQDRELRLSPPLDAWVECVWFLTSTRAGDQAGPPEQRILPDGCVELVCHFDQSHLIHDYAAFAGETPASLLAAEGELSRYFTSPQRLAALFDGRRYG